MFKKYGIRSDIGISDIEKKIGSVGKTCIGSPLIKKNQIDHSKSVIRGKYNGVLKRSRQTDGITVYSANTRPCKFGIC